jgi:hypothetical protein
MSEPEESRRREDGAGEAGGTDKASSSESDAAALRAGHGDGEMPELSDTGVGLGLGEPNTFEPEEAAPAADSPTE